MALYKKSTCMTKVILSELLYRCSTCGHSLVMGQAPDSPPVCEVCLKTSSTNSIMKLATYSAGQSDS